MNNPNFNLMEFHNIKNQAGTNGFIVSSTKFISSTNSIGIRSSAGRYGGTFAHKDIDKHLRSAAVLLVADHCSDSGISIFSAQGI